MTAPRFTPWALVSALGAIAAASATACGSTAPAPSAAKPSLGASSVAAGATSAPAPIGSAAWPAVARPKDVLSFSHSPSPGAALKKLRALGVDPLPGKDFSSPEDLRAEDRVTVLRDEAGGLATPDVLSRAVSPSAAQVDEGKSEYHRVSELGPGRVRFRRLGSNEAFGYVLTAASDGPREIWGDDDVVDTLTPWLAHGLGDAAPAADLWQHFDGAAERRLHARQLDVLRVLDGDLFGWVSSVEGVELTYVVDADTPAVRVRAEVSESSSPAWPTRALADVLGGAAKPPAMFFRMPREAVAAAWGPPVDARFSELVRAALASSVRGGGVSDDLGGRLSSALRLVPRVTGPWVASIGFPAASRPLHAASASRVDALRAAIPWLIVGGEGDLAASIKALADGANALPGKPKVDRAPRGLPKGAATLDISIPVSDADAAALLGVVPGQGAQAPIVLRVALVPFDASHLWWGVSADPELLTRLCGAMGDGAPKSDTIDARTDLGALRAHDGFAGFLRPALLVEGIGRAVALRELGDLMGTAPSLPHRLDTAITFTASASSAGASTVALELVAGRETIEDVAAWISAEKRAGAARRDERDRADREELAKPLGIPECDAYIAELARCASFHEAAAMTARQWRGLANDAKTRPALEQGCKDAKDALEKTDCK